MKKYTQDSITQGLESLGIMAKPAPKDYSPEKYGEYLMSMYPQQSSVSFFSSTNYTPSNENASAEFVRC